MRAYTRRDLEVLQLYVPHVMSRVHFCVVIVLLLVPIGHAPCAGEQPPVLLEPVWSSREPQKDSPE